MILYQIQWCPGDSSSGKVDSTSEHDRLYSKVHCQVGEKHFYRSYIAFLHLCRSYEFVEKSRTEVNWKRTWSASFYLDVKTSSYTRQDEFYAYDIWDLTSGKKLIKDSDTGGNLFLVLQNWQDERVFCYVSFENINQDSKYLYICIEPNDPSNSQGFI